MLTHNIHYSDKADKPLSYSTEIIEIPLDSIVTGDQYGITTKYAITKLFDFKKPFLIAAISVDMSNTGFPVNSLSKLENRCFISELVEDVLYPDGSYAKLTDQFTKQLAFIDRPINLLSSISSRDMIQPDAYRFAFEWNTIYGQAINSKIYLILLTVK